MSPEQEAGQEVDGRADIYSLAVLTYEMLMGEQMLNRLYRQAAGEGPFSTGPRLRTSVQRALTTAMASQPNNRFPTAKAFVTALEAAAARPNMMLVAALGVTAALLALGVARWDTWRSDTIAAAVSTNDGTPRIVLFPLRVPAAPNGRSVHDDLLHQAMSRWRGITLVDQFQVADALRRRGKIESFAEAEAVTKSLGADHYVRGHVTQIGDSVQVYAALFAVGSPRALHQRSEQIPGNLSSAGAAYAALTDSLLLRGANPGTTPGGALESHSLPAVQAVVHAQRALDDWNLAVADSSFEAAVGHDPEFARANLWLAQVKAWRGAPASEWSSVATRAANGTLPDRERRLAEALVHLNEERYEAACDVYNDLRTRNSRDFAAWFGSGQCRTMNKSVVADRASPSGYRFRGVSYHRAMEAYTKAFEILPSVHRGYERGAFEQLRVLLLLSTWLVEGYDNDNARFYGRPAWMGDTLALIPYPWQMVSSGDPRARPPGFDEAIRRQKAAFQKIAVGWSAAYPRSASAKHAVALALDLQNDPAAIDTLLVARQLVQDAARGARLAAAHVLLLAKYGIGQDARRTRYARSLADSLLERPRDNTAATGRLLAPLAALTGRCEIADVLARQAAAGDVIPGLPVHLYVASQGVLARVALGCSAEREVRDLAAATARTVGRSSRDTLSRAYDMLLFRPAILSGRLDSFVLGQLKEFSRNRLVSAASAVANNDLRSGHAELVQWNAGPGTPTPDMAYASAQLWAMTGDTAAAVAQLDRLLNDVSKYEPQILADHVRMSALLRAAALRAEIAMARGDRASAQRWGAPLSILWSSSDAALRPTVQRMEVLARAN